MDGQRHPLKYVDVVVLLVPLQYSGAGFSDVANVVGIVFVAVQPLVEAKSTWQLKTSLPRLAASAFQTGAGL
jgi:hypothetical protein